MKKKSFICCERPWRIQFFMTLKNSFFVFFFLSDPRNITLLSVKRVEMKRNVQQQLVVLSPLPHWWHYPFHLLFYCLGLCISKIEENDTLLFHENRFTAQKEIYFVKNGVSVVFFPLLLQFETRFFFSTHLFFAFYKTANDLVEEKREDKTSLFPGVFFIPFFLASQKDVIDCAGFSFALN